MSSASSVTRLTSAALSGGALVVLLASPIARADAQRVERTVFHAPVPALAPAATLLAGQESGRGSLPLEMLAGAAGSALGMAVVALNADCGVEDLACGIRRAAGAGALGAVGATVAVTLAAGATDAPGSVLGASVGALVGTGVGLGVHWLLNQGTDRNLDDALVIPIFAVSQGTLAALGSRWLGGR